MIKLDLFKLSLRNLLRRKGRTFLTILSVLIGTTSITMMLSLSEGIKRGNERMVEEMGGATLLQISANNFTPGPGGAVPRKSPKLDKKALEKLSALPHIEALIPARQVDGAMLKLKDTRYDFMGSQIWEIDPQQLSKLGLKPAAGSFFNQHTVGDFMIGKGVRIFKVDPRSGAFNPAKEIDPLDSDYKLEFYQAAANGGAPGAGAKLRPRMVGILPSSAPLMPMAVYTNTATARKIFQENERLSKQNSDPGEALKEAAPSGSMDNQEKKVSPDKRQDYDTIFIKVDNIKEVAALRDHITEKLGLPCEGNIDMVESINKQIAQLRLILGGIGGIALLVSAIGIANTMLMSIYERRTEIGVMKVIGASVSDIRQMFLLEAGSIGLFGGVAGLLLSTGLAALINMIAATQMATDMPTPDFKICIISAQLAIFAVVFAALIGLLAGYLPAKKATRVSAIEAIRGN